MSAGCKNVTEFGSRAWICAKSNSAEQMFCALLPFLVVKWVKKKALEKHNKGVTQDKVLKTFVKGFYRWFMARGATRKQIDAVCDSTLISWK